MLREASTAAAAEGAMDAMSLTWAEWESRNGYGSRIPNDGKGQMMRLEGGLSIATSSVADKFHQVDSVMSRKSYEADHSGILTASTDLTCSKDDLFVHHVKLNRRDINRVVVNANLGKADPDMVCAGSCGEKRLVISARKHHRQYYDPESGEPCGYNPDTK